MIDRRGFVLSGAAAALAARNFAFGQASARKPQHFPSDVISTDPYIEDQPIAEYEWASEGAYEDFRDMKFGVRIHWGIYSIWHRGAESWPFLPMSFEDRQTYNSLYKTWNPTGFDAAQWMNTFQESGMKMFAFTTKHHEGFSMFDTKTRVRQRTNWTAPGGPRMEACDHAYSIMETPFKRDIIKELCDAAHKRDIKIDLYFSHPDWYDADFRPYGSHPLQVPSSSKLLTPLEWEHVQKNFASNMVTVPDPTPQEVARMMARHRAQLTELLTNYGKIDMLCLDIHLGKAVWPEFRKTLLQLRSIQPNVMLRNRGIGNYGDYYTPERVVPGSKEAAEKPWLSISPLGSDFSYEPDASKHKGTEWIVHNIIDSSAKGGGFMVGVGPSAHGEFHPEAIRQMKGAGDWLKVNGEAIYLTRPREGTLWAEGDDLRFMRTKDRNTVYAIALKWPGQTLRLKSIRPVKGSSIYMLGVEQPLRWTFDAATGLAITLPEALQQPQNRPCTYAWTFSIQPERG